MRRCWFVPEVVQTSVMDCGPAALTCLLEGFNISASYGRLREACQTSVDGTSIDVIEVVARRLGLDAEQVMLPPDHLWIPAAKALPALVVVKQPNGLLHFVIVWRRHGRWLQIMDPGVGRRWATCADFAREIHLHRLPIATSDWHEWALSDDTLAILASRLRAVGASPAGTNDLLQRAKDHKTWHAMAGLDAALRMTARLVTSGGLRRGTQTIRLLESLFARVLEAPPGARTAVPAAYWSVAPIDHPGMEDQLVFHGAVLLRIRGRLRQASESAIKNSLTPELSAALRERPVRPMRELWALMRGEGILTPLALIGAIGLAVGAVLIESLLFRGVFELANLLTVASQRILALGALLSFITLLWGCELPIISESLRLGRHLEIRLRSALLQKLPTLHDRYLQSRPIPDMAERSHSLSLLRTLPDLAVRFIQAWWEVIFTLVGIGYIAPHSLMLAMMLAGTSLSLAVVAQHPMRERDLRVRGHAGALHGFYLDALRGSIPIRTHSAERAVRREHETLLTEWARSAKRLLSFSLIVQGIQSFVAFGLVGVLLMQHLDNVGVTGSLLLLAYWTLKLPALGRSLATLALQYPAQRNIVLRLLEPLNAPEAAMADAETNLVSSPEESVEHSQVSTVPPPKFGVEIEFQRVTVIAAGQTILQDICLQIQPGEHVAIIGPSGAGKSSLIGLLLGWYRADKGAIFVDRQPLSTAQLRQLRRATAWVDPAIQIWNRSLLENVCYGGTVESYSALGPLLERTELTNVTARLGDGLQTSLGEGGSRLSGGEGQRLRLARAMWQPAARLVLLDEPFRGLERELRHHLLAEARQFWNAASLLCVTHDVAETGLFDRVLVVENGCLVEDGSPDQLGADPTSRYRALLESEESVRQELWAGAIWRRFRLDQGQVQENETSSLRMSMSPRRAVAVGSGKANRG